MEILRIIFAVMIVISLLAMVLLFIDGGKYGKNTMIFNSIAMWSIFISWIDFTSIPVNYSTPSISQRNFDMGLPTLSSTSFADAPG